MKLAEHADRAFSVVHRLLGAEGRPLFALLALLALVVGIWSFVEIADEVLEDEARSIDVYVLTALREPANPAELRGPAWLEGAARDVTALGSTAVLILITLASLGYLWLQRMRAHALLALAAVLGGVLLHTGLKQGFGRARPTVVPALVEEATRSFPSGHSTMAAVVYLSLAVVLARQERRLVVRGYMLAVGATVAALVGVSRVVLGVHYPSDVLAGWSVGLAWAAACWLVLVWLQRSGASLAVRQEGHRHCLSAQQRSADAGAQQQERPGRQEQRELGQDEGREP